MRLSLSAAVACLSITGLSFAEGVSAAMRRPTNIPPQGLGPALQTLAKEHGFQIVYVADEVNALRTQGTAGELTTEEALMQLLRGTGLTYRLFGDNAVSIVSAAAPAASRRRPLLPASAASLLLTTSVGTGVVQAQTPPQEAVEAPVTLETIVVTAQKREERMLDVPASISVANARDLEKVGSAQLLDYASYVPGLHVTNTGAPGRVSMTLRGVPAMGQSATTGIYLDDAPVGSSGNYARTNSFTLDLLPYDLERLEVLRGPQGTLYGASAIGGLVKYVTRQPDLHDTFGRAGSELFAIDGGHEAGIGGQAMVNVSLVPGELAATASYAYRKSPGYIDSIGSGRRDQNEFDHQGGRVALLWQPSQNLSVKLSALRQVIRADGNSTVIGDPATGERIGGGFENTNVLDESYRNEIQYYAATINYDAGFAELTSASSYSRSTMNEVSDLSGVYGGLVPLLISDAPPGLSPLRIDLGFGRFTQEFRLASPTGERIEWLVGAFYTDEKSENDQLLGALTPDRTPISGLDPLAGGTLPSTFEELAVFGNLTFKLSDRFDVTGGLRWAHNEQEFSQVSSGSIVPTESFFGASSESVVTYSISPRWRVSDDAILYARVVSGYRPGGPNFVFPGVPPSVDADTVTNYEIGFKGLSLGRTLQTEITVFLMDWDDIQLNTTFGGIGGLTNGGSASSRGIEAQVVWTPLRGLTVSATAAYTDAKLEADTPPDVGGRDGDRLPNVPRLSGAINADYGFALGESLMARVGAGVRYIGRRYSAVESNPLSIVADEYTAVDLNAGLSADTWALRLYVRNLTNEQGEVRRSLIGDAFDLPAYIAITPLQPRTIGVGIDLYF